MAIETKFVSGTGEPGSMLQVTISGPELLSMLDDGLGSLLASYQPIKMEKITPSIDGTYVFNSVDWKQKPSGDIESLTVIGFRVE